MKRPLFSEYTDGYYKDAKEKPTSIGDTNGTLSTKNTVSDFFATADVLKNNVS